MLTKIKEVVKKYQKEITFFAAIILLISLSFALGIIIGGKIIQRPPIIIEKELFGNWDDILENKNEALFSVSQTTKENAFFVASSRGKYYYPINCHLANNLKEENRIYFSTKEEAENRGYIYNTRCN